MNTSVEIDRLREEVVASMLALNKAKFDEGKRRRERGVDSMTAEGAENILRCQEARRLAVNAYHSALETLGPGAEPPPESSPEQRPSPTMAPVAAAGLPPEDAGCKRTIDQVQDLYDKAMAALREQTEERRIATRMSACSDVLCATIGQAPASTLDEMRVVVSALLALAHGVTVTMERLVRGEPLDAPPPVPYSTPNPLSETTAGGAA